jgi:hypothetical protein
MTKAKVKRQQVAALSVLLDTLQKKVSSQEYQKGKFLKCKSS